MLPPEKIGSPVPWDWIAARHPSRRLRLRRVAMRKTHRDTDFKKLVAMEEKSDARVVGYDAGAGRDDAYRMIPTGESGVRQWSRGCGDVVERSMYL